MKIVIQTVPHVGGFNMSVGAIILYLQEKGLRMSIRDWNPDKVKRNDPVLINIIETLGDKANYEKQKLKIVEIPDGIQNWQIVEEQDFYYDPPNGKEYIQATWE